LTIEKATLWTNVIGEAASGLVELALRSEPDSLDAVHAISDGERTVCVLQHEPLGLRLVGIRLREPPQSFSTHMHQEQILVHFHIWNKLIPLLDPSHFLSEV